MKQLIQMQVEVEYAANNMVIKIARVQKDALKPIPIPEKSNAASSTVTKKL